MVWVNTPPFGVLYRGFERQFCFDGLSEAFYVSRLLLQGLQNGSRFRACTTAVYGFDIMI